MNTKKTVLFLPFLCSVVFFSLIFFSLLNAQVPDTLWTRTFGEADWDFGRSIAQIDSSHYIIAGYSHSFGNGYEVYLIKIDQNGDSLWTKTYGGPNDDEVFDIKRTPSGNLIIAGWTSSYGSGLRDAYLLHMDSDGDTFWSQTYGGSARDIAFAILPTIDDGFILAGETRSSGSGLSDLYLVKTNAQGDSLWAKTFGGTEQDFGYSVIETADSGFIAVGFTESYGSGLGDVYVVKTNAFGDSTWTKTFGGSGDDHAFWIQPASDSGYIITGYSSSTGAGGNDVYALKISENGDSIWARTYGGAQDDVGYDIRSCADGGYFIAGNTRSFGSGNEDLYLLRLSQSGDMIWTLAYGGSSDDGASAITMMPDNGLLIAGETYSFGAGGYDVWLLRIEPEAGVAENRDRRPKTIDLRLACHPNPFVSSTTIHLSGLGQRAECIELQIYDVMGRGIRQFILYPSSFILPAKLEWDGRDQAGNVVPPGIYYIILKNGTQIHAKKLIRIR